MSVALVVSMDKKQIPFLGTMGAAVFRGGDIPKFIHTYKHLSSHRVTYPAAEDIAGTFPYFWPEMIQMPITLLNRHVKKQWEVLKEELNGTMHHADSQVDMCTRL